MLSSVPGSNQHFFGTQGAEHQKEGEPVPAPAKKKAKGGKAKKTIAKKKKK